MPLRGTALLGACSVQISCFNSSSNLVCVPSSNPRPVRASQWWAGWWWWQMTLSIQISSCWLILTRVSSALVPRINIFFAELICQQLNEQVKGDILPVSAALQHVIFAFGMLWEQQPMENPWSLHWVVKTFQTLNNPRCDFNWKYSSVFF